MLRWLRRIGAGLVVVLVLLVLSGAVWEWRGRRAAARAFPLQGKLVDIGGRRIQLDCRGTGSPTVVLISGLDVGGSLSWTAVHDSIAGVTRTCAYSRAGIMWSDPGPEVTAHGVAEDLHAALAKGGEAGPFVLVGHSLGGPYSMAYTKQFGGEVAGLVMVDASHPEQFKRGMLVAMAKKQSAAMTIMKVGSALSWTGLTRLLGGQDNPMPNQDLDGLRAQRAYASTSIQGAVKEMTALPAILEEAGTFRTLGDRPLVVLTAMKLPTAAQLAQSGTTEAQAKEQKEEWRKFHDEEASWSSRSSHRLVPDASHYIQFDRPDIVIDAVRTVVAAVRGPQH